MRRSEDRLFFSSTGSVSARDFADQLPAMRGALGAASHVCNLMQDRFQFSLGLAAAVLNDQITVLPPSDAPEAIVASLEGAAKPVIIGATARQAGNIPRIDPCIDPLQTDEAAQDTQAVFQTLAKSAAEILVFTSGTTKKPQGHQKSWQILRAGASVTDEILGQIDADAGSIGLLGTTPPRHMFGLEATIFATLGFGWCTYQDTIFYPADLEAALAGAKLAGLSRLVLVTSPAHLRFLEPTILAAPEICCVLSATAPLVTGQAERLEARGGLKVMEIYGSTETGSLAARRTIEGPAWTPAAGFRLLQTPQGCLASAPHLPAPVPLGDEVTLEPDGQFVLLGRTGDMVNIRGKRNRLSSLNAILAEAPGISDGVVLHAKGAQSDQLAIAVVPSVADTQGEAALKQNIRKHLMRYVEPSFVPKRILILDDLARTPTGKLSVETINMLSKKAGILT